MSVNLTFPFDNAADYNFNADLISVSGGKAALKIINNPSQTFSQAFTADTGFTYDSAKTEFTGGIMRQKDTRPANATFGANYTSSINGNWGGGSLTASGTGTVSGGKLDLTGDTVKYVDYAALANANSLQTGCIKFKITPNYNVGPVSDNYLFTIFKAAGDYKNAIFIRHTTGDSFGGALILTMYNSSRVAIINEKNFGAWKTTLGTEYEMELNWDITTGATRLFINGVQIGTTATETGVRNTDFSYFRIGCNNPGNSNANFKIDDILVFSSVQHTANYTPGYTVENNIYCADIIDCPVFTYPGVGALQAFTNWATTITSAPHFCLNGKAWNGASWEDVIPLYSNTNTSAEVFANIATLPASDTLTVQILWDDGTTRMDIDMLTVTYTGQTYSTANPTIEGNTSWLTDGIEAFTATDTITGDDNIKYVLKKGTDWYYWTGTAWAVSSDYAQSSTESDIDTNIAAFTTDQATVKFKAYLHSEDGTSTPEISNLEINYSYGGETQSTINTCVLWGYSYNPDNTVNTEQIKIELVSPVYQYKINVGVSNTDIYVTPSATGYWEVELIENENMVSNAKYKVTINQKAYYITVPNAASVNFWTLI